MKIKYFLLLFILFSCSETGKFKIDIEIKDLKKGKLVLLSAEDSLLYPIDSVNVNGQKRLLLQGEIKEPQVLFLDLYTNESTDPLSLSFFAENNEMKLISKLEKYGYDLEVTGSKNDSILRSYLGFNKKFNDQKIELIRRSLENRKDNKNDSILIIDNLLTQLNKRQFLHNANFAMRHSNYEVSPYIAITDLTESKKILDTIYNSLSDEVLKSKYSKILKSIL